MLVILFAVILDTVDSVKDVLGKWGKKAVETTKKGQDLAGNMWQHCKHSNRNLLVFVFSFALRVLCARKKVYFWSVVHFSVM